MNLSMSTSAEEIREMYEAEFEQEVRERVARDRFAAAALTALIRIYTPPYVLPESEIKAIRISAIREAWIWADEMMADHGTGMDRHKGCVAPPPPESAE